MRFRPSYSITKMTRKESVTHTKSLIRKAKCGADVAEAMRGHWSRIGKDKAPALAEALDAFNGSALEPRQPLN